jgi:hypothetical protein
MYKLRQTIGWLVSMSATVQNAGQELLENSAQPSVPNTPGCDENSPTECSARGINHERTVSMFLTHCRLRKTLSHLCNHASGQLTDPISNVVHMMLTCPVQMVISEVRRRTSCPQGLACKKKEISRNDFFVANKMQHAKKRNFTYRRRFYLLQTKCFMQTKRIFTY